MCPPIEIIILSPLRAVPAANQPAAGSRAYWHPPTPDGLGGGSAGCDLTTTLQRDCSLGGLSCLQLLMNCSWVRTRCLRLPQKCARIQASLCPSAWQVRSPGPPPAGSQPPTAAGPRPPSHMAASVSPLSGPSHLNPGTHRVLLCVLPKNIPQGHAQSPTPTYAFYSAPSLHVNTLPALCT